MVTTSDEFLQISPPCFRGFRNKGGGLIWGIGRRPKFFDVFTYKTYEKPQIRAEGAEIFLVGNFAKPHPLPGFQNKGGLIWWNSSDQFFISFISFSIRFTLYSSCLAPKNVFILNFTGWVLQ